MSALSLVAMLGIASTLVMFAALVRQTMRAERAERRLEIAYERAATMEGERLARYIVAGDAR